MAGIYVHIPFCKHRCIYCDFYSTLLLDYRDSYILSLCREFKMRSKETDEKISTIYLGGGTPSVLTYEQLEKLFSSIYQVFKVDESPEVTLECNPDDVNEDFSSFLKNLPINRISMGAQTFNPLRLKFLQRRHTREDIPRAIKLLRASGIKNISIDLMFGFPSETLESWIEDINKAIELSPEHISAYSLMIEEGTPLFSMLQTGQLKEISEELSIAMYEELVHRLSLAGYEHYEISNFSLKGFSSRHNSNYWLQEVYLGFGAAAHSFDLKRRWWNVSNLKEYIKKVNSGVLPIESEEILLGDTMLNDLISRALRTREGLDLDYVEKELGSKYSSYLRRVGENFISSGHLEEKDNHLRLTFKGLLLSNMIMSEMMIV